MQLTRWATSVGLVLSLGCSSGGGGGTVIDSGTTPPTDIPSGTDRPSNTDTPATPTDGARCAATTCGACTPMGGCGWCARTNSCVPGGSTGSTDMSCMGADWDYLPRDCADFDGGPPADVPPVMCGTSTTCGACTPRGGCGWCASTNSCVTGTSTGSTDGTCMGANWQYLPSQCPGFDGGTSCRSVPRTCMLTIAGAVRNCTAGSTVTVGCASACGLGSCTGDPVMQVCPGSATTAPCATTAVIASNDDYETGAMANRATMCGGDAGEDGDVCPALQFTCPADGHYTVWTGAYNPDSTTPAVCTVAVR